MPIIHAGENVIEVEAQPGPAELTLQNNRAVVPVTGVRDRLRVLLVSGEPHAGERVWRSLLKADPSVDLVHFTILRPPDKQDATPITELSLIAFPTRELFVEKLDQFDLVIFDRCNTGGGLSLIPLAYFENIARYVENGGALLIASGPEFADQLSIYRTPLAAVLPAQPTGDVITQPFKPLVTDAGLAHPVTRDLPGANANGKPPSWGRWFRLVGTSKVSGETLMAGPDNRPLLVLDRAGQGPRGGIPVRSGMAVGARLRRRRSASRVAAPAGALADEGAGAGGGAAVGRHRQRPHRHRAPHHGGAGEARDTHLSIRPQNDSRA